METSPHQPKKPVKRQRFHKTKLLNTREMPFSLIEDTHLQAERWINKHPEREVVQIQTFHSPYEALTVVWYR